MNDVLVETFGESLYMLDREEVITLQRFVDEVKDQRILNTLKSLVVTHRVNVDRAIAAIKTIVKL